MPDPQYDMVAMNFAAMCEAVIGPRLDKLCECIQSHSQQAGVMPCDGFPLLVKGSVSQTFNCHVASMLYQVPKGEIATITRVTFAERYPGVLYGANFTLIVNDNFVPNFARIDHSMGSNGMQVGLQTRVCLEEQDLLSVMIQCSWLPVQFTGMADTYVQTLFPFEVSGWSEVKQVYDLVG